MLPYTGAQPHLQTQLAQGLKSDTLGSVSDAAWAVALRQDRILRAPKVVVQRELRISNFQTEFRSPANSSSRLFLFLETSNPDPQSPIEGAFESPDLNVPWG